MELSKSDRKRIKVLIETCKSKQGEYLPSHHGSGSWATTYSNEFIDSACELYLLFKSMEFVDPIHVLSYQLRKAGIRSCRGSEFNADRVEYLYTVHLRRRIEELEHKKKFKAKVSCLYCERKVFDLTQHVSHAHPEKWNSFFVTNSVDLKGKTRCGACGSFLKSMRGHSEKCLRTFAVRN